MSRFAARADAMAERMDFDPAVRRLVWRVRVGLLVLGALVAMAVMDGPGDAFACAVVLAITYYLVQLLRWLVARARS